MNRTHCLSPIFLACLFIFSRTTPAAPVTADSAASAVRGWLRQDRKPLGSQLSPKVKRTDSVKDGSGNVLYYAVQLDPSGFVILPADDAAGSVVAFSASGSFDASSRGPLAALVNKDLPRRLARARAGGASASAAKSRGQWRAFMAGSSGPPPDSEENGNIVVASQVWIAPFLQTLWNQGPDVSLNYACYNYYTPPNAAGDVDNDVCGCVATCLAQIVYYFQYPDTGVGTASFWITNSGTPQMTTLLGGNGSGGPYVWSEMPLSPNNPTATQAMAIGALTHDAGATVNMDYTPDDSSAFTYVAQQALTNTFRFAHAAYYENVNGLSGSNLVNMINPNLDARLPVSLGIEPAGGHCLLADGYGYSSGTLFHHLNCGWGGDDDIWYALPAIDTPDNGDFTTVEACIYNIYTNGSGQLISGRVTDPTGAPVAGAAVTAQKSGGGSYSATTDSNGIYALARIPAASSYTLTVSNAGAPSVTGNYSTGTSVYNQLPSGNVWGANFVLTPPLLIAPETGFASIGPTNGPFSVTSQVYILSNTSASSITWTLSSVPTWMTASSSGGPLAAGAMTNLTLSLNSTANSLGAGTYAASVWITNVNNGYARALQFSLSVKTADYPIAVTGFNLDVVVENTAVGGNTYNYADTFDSNCAFVNPSGTAVCFYESGLPAINYFNGRASATSGLPPGGLITNEFDHATTFQLAPYTSGNVLYLTSTSNSGTLTLGAPAAYKSLSVLAASAQGAGNGALVIQFMDGSTNSPISFNADNYISTNSPGAGAAYTNFGLLTTGDYNEYGSVDNSSYFPTLYQTTINLQSLGLNTNPIRSVTFTMPSGAGASANTVTGIFALSGTEATVNNSPVSFVTGAGALGYSAGKFAMEVTNLTGQGPVVISASTNLLQWVPIYTNPSGYGAFFFTDSNAGAFTHRFYRATTP